jgi:hypothetical protein
VVSRTKCLRPTQLEGCSSVRIAHGRRLTGVVVVLPCVCMLDSESVGRDDLHVGWIVGTGRQAQRRKLKDTVWYSNQVPRTTGAGYSRINWCGRDSVGGVAKMVIVVRLGRGRDSNRDGRTRQDTTTTRKTAEAIRGSLTEDTNYYYCAIFP